VGEIEDAALLLRALARLHKPIQQVAREMEGFGKGRKL